VFFFFLNDLFILSYVYSLTNKTIDSVHRNIYTCFGRGVTSVDVRRKEFTNGD